MATARQMAAAGIYNLRIHRDQVVLPLLRHWRIFDRDDLPAAAEPPRDQIAAVVAELEQLATRQQQRIDERHRRENAASDRRAV
jgi:acyl-[acyl-carrier-protein] desaturase